MKPDFDPSPRPRRGGGDPETKEIQEERARRAETERHGQEDRTRTARGQHEDQRTLTRTEESETERDERNRRRRHPRRSQPHSPFYSINSAQLKATATESIMTSVHVQEPSTPNRRTLRARAAAMMLPIVACGVAHRRPVDAFVVHSALAPKHAAINRLVPTSPTKTCPNRHGEFRSRNVLRVTATASDKELEAEISSMKAKEIRQELQSYGISTKSFFEKSELVDALVQARKEGRTPVGDGVNGASASDASGGADRLERIRQEMENCKGLKVGELKKELESYGISTKSYFEKSEFVRAVAEVRVDGPPKATGDGGGGSRSARGRAREEPRDPSYRDVVVSKFQGNKGALGRIIDVRAR
ncbi:hypothetical protein ACHAWF_001671 [Thalassiosira exigua]